MAVAAGYFPELFFLKTESQKDFENFLIDELGRGRESSSTHEWHPWKIIWVACKGPVLIFPREHPGQALVPLQPQKGPRHSHCSAGSPSGGLRRKEHKNKIAHSSVDCFPIRDEVYSDDHVSVLLYDDCGLCPVRRAPPSKELSWFWLIINWK